jgi:hypothetical protein
VRSISPGSGEVRIGRAGSLAALITGFVIGAISITWAALAWPYDQLITPKGWIIVAGTTACALTIFLGALGYQRARDREYQMRAATTAEQAQVQLRLLRDAIPDMVTKAVVEAVAEAMVEHRRLVQAMGQRLADGHEKQVTDKMAKAVKREVGGLTEMIGRHMAEVELIAHRVGTLEGRINKSEGDMQSKIGDAVKRAYAEAYVDAQSGMAPVRKLPGRQRKEPGDPPA